MGAACCNHRTHRKSNLRQHLTSSSTAQIYGNEIKEQNRQKKHPKDNNQKDNNRKYSMLGPLRRGNLGYSRQSATSDNKEASNFPSSHLMHLVTELNRFIHFEPTNDDSVHEYIDWALSMKHSGEVYWINKGIVKFTKEQERKISEIDENQIHNKDFLTKRIWVLCYMKMILSDNIVDNPFIVVSRNKILEDSLNQFKTVQGLNLKRSLHIHFIDEEAKDVGGVYREWFSCLLHEFLVSNKKLFTINTNSGPGKNTVLVNYESEENGNILEYYEFFGKIIAKALIDRILLNENLNYVLLKQLMKRQITFDDLKYIDIEIYSSLKEINKSNIEEPNLNLPFVWNIRDRTTNELKRIELIENGANTAITNQNKAQFLEKVTEFITYKSLKPKIDAICSGFHSLIPIDKINIFSVEEFDFLLSGQNEIDINDWKSSTEYKGGYTEQSDSIVYFWEVLKEITPEQLHSFFTFCTGNARTPINGFRMLQSSRNRVVKFSIERQVYDKNNCMIQAKTCFNRLYLPDYKNKELLKENILKIVMFDTNYFGLE